MYEVHKQPNQFHAELNKLVKAGKLTKAQAFQMFKEATHEYYSTLRVS